MSKWKDSDISFDELQPRAFSFNSPFGACSTCDGLGTQVSIDPELVIPDERKSGRTTYHVCSM